MRRTTQPGRHRPHGQAAAWLAAVTPVLLTGAAAYAGHADHAPETVTFDGNGPEPVLCTSRPDRQAVTIEVGAALVLVNYTGTSAKIDLGQGAPVTLADGEAVTVKLRTGEHSLRLTPECLLTFDDPVTVDVVPAAMPAGTGPPITPGRSRSPSAPPPAPPGSPTPDSPTPSAGLAPTTATESQAPPMVGSATTGQAGPPATADRPGTPAEPVAVPGTSEPTDHSEPLLDGIVAGPYPFPGRGDFRDSQLVAVVAAILVLGVTSGIIRAIVAQRSTRASSILHT